MSERIKFPLNNRWQGGRRGVCGFTGDGLGVGDGGRNDELLSFELWTLGRVSRALTETPAASPPNTTSIYYHV